MKIGGESESEKEAIREREIIRDVRDNESER